MAKNVRRVVTGHGADGRSTVLIDSAAPNQKQRQAGNVSTLLWVTDECPARMSSAADAAARDIGVPPPRRASISPRRGVLGDFLQLVISGTAVGAIYALAALGFTLLWQASGTINFAQGEFVMVPAFITLLCLGWGMPLPLAFVVTCLVAMALLGVAFKKAVVDPLRRHGVIPLVIATLGLSIGLKNLVKAGYSAGPQPFPNIFPDTLLRLGPLRVSAYDIGALVLAGLIVVGLQTFLNRT